MSASRLTYRQIADGEFYSSRFSAVIKRASIGIVFALQDLPLTPNFFSTVSFVFAAAAAGLLLWLDGAAGATGFIGCSLLAFVFDQVDGTWARLKKQSTTFGAFYDPFLDALKFFAVEIALLVTAQDALLALTGGPIGLAVSASGYFLLRELYTMSALPRGWSGAPSAAPAPARLPLGFSSAAARFCLLFPVLVLVPSLIPWYFAASALMYATKVYGFVLTRYRASTPT